MSRTGSRGSWSGISTFWGGVKILFDRFAHAEWSQIVIEL